MDKDTARVVFTWDCGRDCLKCCNKQDFVRNAPHIKGIREILVQERFETIVITGGEPLRYPVTLLRVLKQITNWHADNDDKYMSVYLQTNTWSPRIKEMMLHLTGVNYSVHADNLCDKDMDNFKKMDNFLREHMFSHNKLWVDHKVFDTYDMSFTAEEGWDQITIGSMVDDCPLPENEELFILESAVL